MHDTLRKIRKENDLTQQELANMLGVSRSCVANWEAGTREADITVIKKYNDMFGHRIDFANSFIKLKNKNLCSLDISMLNDSGTKKILKFYNEIINNPQFLKM